MLASSHFFSSGLKTFATLSKNAKGANSTKWAMQDQSPRPEINLPEINLNDYGHLARSRAVRCPIRLNQSGRLRANDLHEFL